jgi:hypothetical protein
MNSHPSNCPGYLYPYKHLGDCPARNTPIDVYNEDMKDDHVAGTCVPPLNESIKIPTADGPVPGVDVPHFVTGMTVARIAVTEGQAHALELEKEIIEQKIVPSTGTKLVCTSCGTQEWHTLILRRKAGLIEGLCKQVDGSGCYPLSSRRGCQYVYPNAVNCPQMSEYCVAIGEERRNERQVCRDHVGEMLRQGPLYQVWPLED